MQMFLLYDDDDNAMIIENRKWKQAEKEKENIVKW